MTDVADRRKDTAARARSGSLKGGSQQSSHIVDVEKVLDNYDDAFLSCRDLGHQWKVAGYFRQSGEIQRQLRCPQCNTTSTDHWRATGERLGRRYSYAEGYQIRGSGGVDRAAIRRETLSRVDIYPSEAAMVASLMNGGKKK